MKTDLPKSSRWSGSETQLLREFIAGQESGLLTNFYKNIFLGQLNFRRPAKFFKKMSGTIGRSPKQCKSKMQKFEKEAFVGILRVPEEHYRFYLVLRKLKTMSRKTQNVSEMFKKRNGFETKRQAIISEVCSGGLLFKSGILFLY